MFWGENIENVRSEKDIKLVTIDVESNKLVSQPNFYSSKYFSENLLGVEMRDIKVNKNKSMYLGMTELDISKIPMYDFLYEYLKPRYKRKY